jgi:hypothetical protein
MVAAREAIEEDDVAKGKGVQGIKVLVSTKG